MAAILSVKTPVPAPSSTTDFVSEKSIGLTIAAARREELGYFTPFLVSTMVIRCALQAGLGPDQLASIMAGQSERLIGAEDLLDVGPAPGRATLGFDILLERLYSLLVVAVGRMMVGDTGYEPLALARLACELAESGSTEGEVARHVLAILDRQERFARENPADGAPFFPGMRLIMLAACIARTPGAPLPPNPEFLTAADIRSASMAGHRPQGDAQLPRPSPVRSEVRRSSLADHMLMD